MTETKIRSETPKYKKPEHDIFAWNQHLPWTYLKDKTIGWIDPDEGKFMIYGEIGNNLLYIGEFGALVFLNGFPCGTKIKYKGLGPEDDIENFKEIHIDDVHASFPPRKIGEDGREKINYQELNMAGVATLFSYVGDSNIPHRYVVKANLIDTPTTILMKHVL